MSERPQALYKCDWTHFRSFEDIFTYLEEGKENRHQTFQHKPIKKYDHIRKNRLRNSHIYLSLKLIIVDNEDVKIRFQYKKIHLHRSTPKNK